MIQARLFIFMNTKYVRFLLPLLVCAGCASAGQATRLEPVGPDPALIAPHPKTGNGFLQVYSARERVPIDVNAEEYFKNGDYGRNDALYHPAHTGYVIYGSDGHRMQTVSNGTDMNRADLATVELSPGVYQVQAKAEDGDATLTVMVPVVIEPGLTTVVHLDGKWRPACFPKPDERVVYLPNGQAVGWHSPAARTDAPGQS